MTLLNSNIPIPEEKPKDSSKQKMDEDEEEKKKQTAKIQPRSQPKQSARVVVHKGMSSHQPKDDDRRRTSVFGRKPSRPATVVNKRTAPAPQVPAPVESKKPEMVPQTDSHPVPPANNSQKDLSRNGKGLNPGLRLRALEAAGKNVAPPQPSHAAPPPEKTPVSDRKINPGSRVLGLVQPPTRDGFKNAGKKIYNVFSVTLHFILFFVVLVLAICIGYVATMLNGVLGGLYNSFVQMDKSTITTTISVDQMPIPIAFNLPVVQDETTVTLTQDVTIRGAFVTINTGALNINAPATVTLPKGTELPIALRMDVPVQTTVFVDLKVPVNIKLAEANPPAPAASLHSAFNGLQSTIGNLYCPYNHYLIDILPKKYRPGSEFMVSCDGLGNYLGPTP
jgi:hypothetical protein